MSLARHCLSPLARSSGLAVAIAASGCASASVAPASVPPPSSVIEPAAPVDRAITAEEVASDYLDLSQSSTAKRYSLESADPDVGIDAGGAAIVVRAPIASVRKVVTDYARYTQLFSSFKQSRVLSRSKAGSDVYFMMPVAHGAAQIWVVTRMAPALRRGAGETIAGRLIKGNVDAFSAVWHLAEVDPATTIVKLELLVAPRLPLPSSLLTRHLKAAADRAVTAVRARAEQSVALSTLPTPPAPPTPLPTDQPPAAAPAPGSAMDAPSAAPSHIAKNR